jgi:hypothetical protein
VGDVPHEQRDHNWDYIQPKKWLKRDEEQEADTKMEKKTLTSSSVSMSCSTRPVQSLATSALARRRECAELALSLKGWASGFGISDMLHIGTMLFNEWPNPSSARPARTKSLKSRTREERGWAREGHRLEADAAWM